MSEYVHKLLEINAYVGHNVYARQTVLCNAQSYLEQL